MSEFFKTIKGFFFEIMNSNKNEETEKQRLAERYKCQPQDIDIKITKDNQNDCTIKIITIDAPIKIEGDFEG